MVSPFPPHLQLQGLGPLCSKLPELERQYSALTRALDATRHEMAVKGVLPVDEGTCTIAVATTDAHLNWFKLVRVLHSWYWEMIPCKRHVIFEHSRRCTPILTIL